MRPAPLLTALLLTFTAATLQAQDELEDIREQLKNSVRNSDIGAGYAQMLNFFIDPSISASYLESDDGTRYDVFKVPIQYTFPLNEGRWQLAVRGALSRAQAENRFELLEGEVTDGTWTAHSGQVGVGLMAPFSESMSWIVAGQFGISRLENKADYNGGLTEAILAPLIDGVLFNWDTNARVSSLSGGLDYRDRLADRYELEVLARYTYSRIESYSESRDLVPFSADTGTLSAKADLRHPFSATLGDRPLFGVAHLGATAFTGPNRNALGFSHFYELGYSLGVDVSEHNRFFRAFRFGYQLNLGSDIEGHSLLFGWELK
jgi:hypothetical protein